jgi:hypothetical protein
MKIVLSTIIVILSQEVLKDTCSISKKYWRKCHEVVLALGHNKNVKNDYEHYS